MKKVLAILVSLALVALLLPSFGISAFASENPYSDVFNIYNLDGTVSSDAEVLGCSQKDGQITIKVKLGANDYVQFAQPVTDLINNPGALQVNLENHEFGTTPGTSDTDLVEAYKTGYFLVELTDDADYTVTTTDAAWVMVGCENGRLNNNYSSNPVVLAGPANAATNGFVSGVTYGWQYITTVSNGVARGTALSYNFVINGDQINLSSSISGATGGISEGNDFMNVPWSLAEDTPLYPRILSSKSTAQVYNIRLNSKDIVGPYANIVKIHNLTGAISEDAEIISCVKEDGSITVKVKLGVDDYIQFAQPVTDLINNPGAVEINLANHEFGTAPGTGDTDLADAYFNCDIRLELIDNSDYTTKDVNARWVLTAPGIGYTNVVPSNPYIIVSAGSRSGGPNAWRYIAQRNSLMARGVALSLTFKRDAETNRIRLDSTYSDKNTGSDADCLFADSFQPSDGDELYVRLRSNKVQTYSIRLNSADINASDEPVGEFEMSAGGTLRYLVEGVAQYKGVVEYEGHLYYINSTGESVRNQRNYYVTKTNDIVPAGYYDFDANGYMEASTGTAITANLNLDPDGKIRYYEGGVAIYAGLVNDGNGNIYYIGSDCTAVVGKSYFVSKTNGLVVPAFYTFDNNGIMQYTPNALGDNLILDNDGVIRYYNEGVADYKGVTQDSEGNFYYVNSTKRAVTNQLYFITKTNGLLPSANYNIDADGKILAEFLSAYLIADADGIIRYFANGESQYAGVAQDDNGNYYYINSTKKAVKSADYIVTKTNDLIPAGLYTIGANGIINVAIS